MTDDPVIYPLTEGENMKAVLVTTEHRGVFFGYYDGPSDAVTTVKLNKARNCIYWATSMRGFMGLAATGPNKECKIGPAVPSITLQGVTSVVECSSEAVTAWESQPWGK